MGKSETSGGHVEENSPYLREGWKTNRVCGRNPSCLFYLCQLLFSHHIVEFRIICLLNLVVLVPHIVSNIVAIVILSLLALRSPRPGPTILGSTLSSASHLSSSFAQRLLSRSAAYQNFLD